jgi:hypothetical protein
VTLRPALGLGQRTHVKGGRWFMTTAVTAKQPGDGPFLEAGCRVGGNPTDRLRTRPSTPELCALAVHIVPVQRMLAGRDSLPMTTRTPRWRGNGFSAADCATRLDCRMPNTNTRPRQRTVIDRTHAGRPRSYRLAPTRTRSAVAVWRLALTADLHGARRPLGHAVREAFRP